MSSSLQTRVTHRPPTEKATTTAPVHEFICLFTHDLKRKNQKRWQDGKLKFHTYNKRIVVHDQKGNYIGDSHWSGEQEEFADGEEFTLDRGSALVQVCEQVGTTEHDLGDLVDKRVKEVEARRMKVIAQASGATPHRQHMPRPTDNVQFQRPLSAIMHTPGQIGRSVVPRQSPYEIRRAEKQEGEDGATPRPAKRRKRSVSPPAKSGHARNLFGTQLTLSASSASISAARIRVMRDQANARREQEEGRLSSSTEDNNTSESTVQEVELEKHGQVATNIPEDHARKFSSARAFAAAIPQETRLKVASLHAKAKRRIQDAETIKRNLDVVSAAERPPSPRSYQEEVPQRKKPRTGDAHEPPECEVTEAPKSSVLQNRAANRLAPTKLSRATPSLHSITKRVEEREEETDEVICLETKPRLPKPAKPVKRSTSRIQQDAGNSDNRSDNGRIKTAERSPTIQKKGLPISIDDESDSTSNKPQPRTALRIKSKRKRGLMMLAEKKAAKKPIERPPSPPPPINDDDLPVEVLSVEDQPVEDLPDEDIPVDDLLVDDLPVEDIPVDYLPVEELSAGDLPVEESPVGDRSFEEWLAAETPLGDDEICDLAVEYGNESPEIDKVTEQNEPDVAQNPIEVNTETKIDPEEKQPPPDIEPINETPDVSIEKEAQPPPEIESAKETISASTGEEIQPVPEIKPTKETLSVSVGEETQPAVGGVLNVEETSSQTGREKTKSDIDQPSDSKPPTVSHVVQRKKPDDTGNCSSEESDKPQPPRTREQRQSRVEKARKKSPPKETPESSPEWNNDDDSQDSDDWQGPTVTTKQKQVRTRTAPARSKKESQAKPAGPQLTRMARKSIKSKEIIGFKPPVDNNSMPGAYVSAFGRIGLQEVVPSANLRRSLSMEDQPPPVEQQTIKRHEPPSMVRQQSDPQPKGRLVNPATRGKKAASKADAAAQMPQTLVPFEPVTRLIGAPKLVPPTLVKEKKKAAAPETVPSRESKGSGQTLPGFSKANGGAWSRHAEDLLGMTRPETNGTSRI